MTSCNQTSLDFSADDLRCTIPRPAPPHSIDIYYYSAHYTGLDPPGWLRNDLTLVTQGSTVRNAAECGTVLESLALDLVLSLATAYF